MSEQTMTATELLDAGSAGRTAHMETIHHPADPLTRALAWDEDVLVRTAEVQHEGRWRTVIGVFTDLNDDERPIFLDLDEPAERVLIAHKDRIDTVTVRGLTS